MAAHARASTRTKTVGKKTAHVANGHASDDNRLKVRMYRVGFGDFFLVTVPTAQGPRYILIDCGVHAANIDSMPACVQDLVRVTGRKLALVIVTHYHADHLSGFSSESEEFSQFEVEAVWITNRLDPNDPAATDFRQQINALAAHLQLQLAARADDHAVQALAKVENALGGGGTGNDKALRLVTHGFRNSPPVHYYEAGDVPALPASLKGALTATILGPSPKAMADEFTASDNRTEQYLSAVRARGLPDTRTFAPFERSWPATSEDYPPEAFHPWTAPAAMEEALLKTQPDYLTAAADAIDGTLNNQSLVVLFTCHNRRLLFVGDAQWGNWAYWLYGRPVKGKDAEISDEARKILSSIDFYKVGHHGSTNATPIPVVGAIPDKCVAMCSTETGFPAKKRTYGSIERKTEVPRIALMEALEKRTGARLVRSDWIAAGTAKASPEARKQLEKLPADFEVGGVYIEYVFPN